ncbi:MAG: rhodanese-like domain-containing protein [Pseudomonadota bacterium]|nr:rhodanese-like domain-containing protein [Pseudomonadota bacterium]
MDVQTLHRQMQAGTPPVLVDVREAGEVAVCSLPGALHIPLGSLPQRFSEIPKDRPVVIHCHHGGRSGRAVAWLLSQGYSQVRNLEGGIDAWARRIDPNMSTY